MHLLAKCDSIQGEPAVLAQELQTASQNKVPNRLVKVKGPKHKLTPAVKKLESISKLSFFKWKQVGSSGPEHPISIQRKIARNEVCN